MCSIWTHWKINHIAINKRGRRILAGNMDPLWIEVILAHIGMIWNVTHGVFFSTAALSTKLTFLIYVDAFKPQLVRAYDITIRYRARGQTASFARALLFMLNINDSTSARCLFLGYSGIFPSFSWGNIRSRDALRPIAGERKDYNLYINFENRAHCEKYLKGNKHNSLHLARK